MGILTYIKIGLALAVLSACGYYVYNYHHMQKVIVGLQEDNKALKEGQETLTSKADKFEKFMTTTAQARRKVRDVEGKVDTVPVVPDATGDRLVLELLDSYRVPDDRKHSALGGKGTLKLTPGRPTAPKIN